MPFCWLPGRSPACCNIAAYRGGFAESLFRTATYRPEFPARGFDTLDVACAWAAEFVRWGKVEHRHSGIRWLSRVQAAREAVGTAGVLVELAAGVQPREHNLHHRHLLPWMLPAGQYRLPFNHPPSR